MDEILQNIISNLGGKEIGIDEEFKFHCTECGKCCIHREDILLNPMDIYNMSRELGISTQELFGRYCETCVSELILFILQNACLHFVIHCKLVAD